MSQASSEAFLAGKLLKQTLSRALGLGSNLSVAHAQPLLERIAGS
jgi:hypothetical protein